MTMNDDKALCCNCLTAREKDVGVWLIGGMTAKQIARILKISVHTVEGYQRTIKRKTKGKTPYQVGYILGKLLEVNLSENASEFPIHPHT